MSREEAALFVMPSPSKGQAGPVGVWITAAGWAGAAEQIWGRAWIRTPEGVHTPEEARVMASRPDLAPPGGIRNRGSFLDLAATARHDLRQWGKARRFRRAALDGPWNSYDLMFVWQRHDIFHRAGFDVARALKKPLVLFVDAPLVWETAQWGVRRPGWGRLLEFLGEWPQFRGADLVACVSDEVAEQVVARGGSERRILVTPCSVDTDLFAPVRADGLRDTLGLGEKFVIGWAGSFRRFHGVEIALEAIARLQTTIPEVALLLVGDGRERPRMQALAEQLRLRTVVFTGTVPHGNLPRYLGAMDVALLLDEGRHSFHYSPLKLKEYMACARAVVAPRVGEMVRTLSDGQEALLIPPGDAGALAAAIERLHRDPLLRQFVGTAAREKALRDGSWRRQVERAWDAVKGKQRDART